jgi:hypothetical protein
MMGTKNIVVLDTNIDAIVYWEDELISYDDEVVIYN